MGTNPQELPDPESCSKASLHGSKQGFLQQTTDALDIYLTKVARKIEGSCHPCHNDYSFIIPQIEKWILPPPVF